MDSFERFNEKRLQPIQAFASSLNNGENTSQKDYKHAAYAWEQMGCKDLGNNQDLYLKSDVLLLTDVFESYSKILLKYYELEPCH